jgi:ribosomal-protein-alanine N-acetyltransferase
LSLVLETPRLALRELSIGDLDFVAEMLADPLVMRFYPRCYSRSEARLWLQRQRQRYAVDGHGLWLVLDKVVNRPVGQVGLIARDVLGTRESEVGYLIHRSYWRQGFASAAAAATRDYAFYQLDKPRVIALIRPENLPSQGVARKIGLSPAARTILCAGCPHLVFSMTRPGSESKFEFGISNLKPQI